ncbi:MAG TPA: lytic transglycosylase domain-containing protein [Nitrospirota bacterium]
MSRNTMYVLAIAAFLCLFAHPVSADIYQYTDDQGVVHFSNVNVSSGKKFKRIKPVVDDSAASAPASRRVSREANSISSSNMPSAYVDIINTACDRHGIDPALVHAVVKVESDFNPYALSRKGAMGLMQLMPQTAVDLNVRNSFNPHDNIDGGVRYLRYLIDRYEGNLSLALAAYNSGESAVKRWGTIPPFPETQNYVQRILKIYRGGNVTLPRYTIYIGHGEDGAILLTDTPGNHRDKNFKRKSQKSL